MTESSAFIAGELGHPIPSMQRMASILREAGLQIQVGRYSIRVEDCSHFTFQEYRGDLGDPVVDADADTIDEMIRDAKLISGALSNAGIKHRFEVYRHAADEMVAYFHCDWPLTATSLHRRRLLSVSPFTRSELSAVSCQLSANPLILIPTRSIRPD
jgi:hypothetical protein